jgi:hypothetical protein
VKEVTTTYASLQKVQSAPKNAPVIVKGDKGSYTLQTDGYTADQNINSNKLVVSTGTAVTGYVLAEKNSKVGFYKWAGGALSEGKVYLPVPANAREFIGISFEATGINTAKAAETNGMVYNLQGQRVVKAQKGLYIVNGKKVIKN